MRSPEKRASRRSGFSLMELLIAIAIILVILGFALPNLMQANMRANEAGAKTAMQTINQGQTMYLSTFKRYAATLAELGPPPGGGAPSPQAAGMVPEDLAAGLKSGYVFTMVGSPGGYVVTAEPQSFGTSGSMTLYTDQTLVVREHFGEGQASATDPPI